VNYLRGWAAGGIGTPDNRANAVPTGQHTALCGVAIPDVGRHPWPPLIGERCRECEQTVQAVTE
jgi:hypothetical protein